MIEDQKDIDKVLHFQNLSYISEIIYKKLINQYYNNLLFDYFRINKTQELVTQKYNQIIFCYNIKAYVKSSDIFLALKIVKHKLYSNF